MQSGGRPVVDTSPLPFTPADVPRAPPIGFRTLFDRLRHCHAGGMEESPEAGGGQAAAVAPRYNWVRRRKWGTWVAEVRLPSSRARLWLGSCPTPEMAARDVPPSADKLSGYEIREAAARNAAREGPKREEEGGAPRGGKLRVGDAARSAACGGSGCRSSPNSTRAA
ncbi:AP2 [Musa troglodytarum]|uniref:AP2 n=1 Tax=Musa troglodytarum TaxID=320322 RepID=A0A9E7FAY2_9LILI|nr:AP2 [Musa troglodytarum]